MPANISCRMMFRHSRCMLHRAQLCMRRPADSACLIARGDRMRCLSRRCSAMLSLSTLCNIYCTYMLPVFPDPSISVLIHTTAQRRILLTDTIQFTYSFACVPNLVCRGRVTLPASRFLALYAELSKFTSAQHLICSGHLQQHAMSHHI
jgi:hypothetical protein